MSFYFIGEVEAKFKELELLMSEIMSSIRQVLPKVSVLLTTVPQLKKLFLFGFKNSVAPYTNNILSQPSVINSASIGRGIPIHWTGPLDWIYL